jgi:hypothetical protein
MAADPEQGAPAEELLLPGGLPLDLGRFAVVDALSRRPSEAIGCANVEIQPPAHRRLG